MCKGNKLPAVHATTLQTLVMILLFRGTKFQRRTIKQLLDNLITNYRHIYINMYFLTKFMHLRGPYVYQVLEALLL